MQPSASGRRPRYAHITIPWPTAALLALVALAASPAAQDIGARSVTSAAATSGLPPGVRETHATIGVVSINYKAGGAGPVGVLLHGFAQTSHIWMPLMPLLMDLTRLSFPICSALATRSVPSLATTRRHWRRISVDWCTTSVVRKSQSQSSVMTSD
jgi:hypothetical protein